MLIYKYTKKKGKKYVIIPLQITVSKHFSIFIIIFLIILLIFCLFITFLIILLIITHVRFCFQYYFRISWYIDISKFIRLNLFSTKFYGCSLFISAKWLVLLKSCILKLLFNFIIRIIFIKSILNFGMKASIFLFYKHINFNYLGLILF